MSEQKVDKTIEEKTDLIIELPRRHIMLRLKGSVTSYGLYHIKPKTKGEYEKDLDLVGYYGSLNSGIKGFLKHVPDRDLTGRKKIEEIYDYYNQIREELSLDNK